MQGGRYSTWPTAVGGIRSCHVRNGGTCVVEGDVCQDANGMAGNLVGGWAWLGMGVREGWGVCCLHVVAAEHECCQVLHVACDDVNWT